MAESAEHRGCTRQTCNFPLKFALQHSRAYLDATVFNISEQGIYLEADSKLKPGADITIRLTDVDANGLERLSIEMSKATIIWCAKVEKGGGHFYGAGINFPAAEMSLPADSASYIEYHCDMCGKRMDENEVIKIHDNICFCTVCHIYLDSFPEALRKRCIERFLMGNYL
jgi:hypothetical protein